MLFYSLQQQSPTVTFREAAIKGQAPDKGLYFPSSVPVLNKALVSALKTIPKEELSYQVLQPYIGDSIDEGSLRTIIEETINFPFPLVQVTDQCYALELFHGPTLAFKDVGARFMSRCLGYFSRNNDRKLTVLVATSGDTGGAVASGFLGVEGVEVIILYPSGKVSPVQEMQLTTCGQNIIALEIAGSFDDCQAMVKEAFMDAQLQDSYQLTSANSINVARWLPQQLYYFFAYQQWEQEGAIPAIAVPSGNFGNIGAGLLAKRSGLPVNHFLAACNANDTVSHYLQTGEYIPRSSVSTVSNAMDVGDPSNLIRVRPLFNNDRELLLRSMSSVTVTDEETMLVMRRVKKDHGYLLDPHGAVGYAALEKKYGQGPGVFLATAHPVKFPDVVEQATGEAPALPAGLRTLLQRKKQAIQLDATFGSLKEWMLARDPY